MHILQAHYDDFVPRYQILMFDDSKIYGPCLQWQEPTTVWDGTPVMGFMAETYLDDLSTKGFKDFNPMWTFPTTAVNQCWDALTFGMSPWHVGRDTGSQSVQGQRRSTESVTDCSIQGDQHVASIGHCL